MRLTNGCSGFYNGTRGKEIVTDESDWMRCGVIIMTIEEMKRLKRERGYTIEQISEWSGVPLGTVQKIFSGETKSPRYDTILALEKFFSDEHHGSFPGPVHDYPAGGEPVLVKEKSIADELLSGRKGKYTAEDYRRIREEERIELIDGVIYNLAAPTTKHQFVISEIVTELNLFIRGNRGDCIPFPAPVSVYLDCDESTVVEPDISVLCDRKKLVGGDIWGAPDLVMEILSPSTRRKDMTLKHQKYAMAGVREYWIIDLREEKVIVYDFARDYLISLYFFRDKVPVGIWDGQFEIDFGRISDAMTEIYGDA